MNKEKQDWLEWLLVVLACLAFIGGILATDREYRKAKHAADINANQHGTVTLGGVVTLAPGWSAHCLNINGQTKTIEPNYSDPKCWKGNNAATQQSNQETFPY